MSKAKEVIFVMLLLLGMQAALADTVTTIVTINISQGNVSLQFEDGNVTYLTNESSYLNRTITLSRNTTIVNQTVLSCSEDLSNISQQLVLFNKDRVAYYDRYTNCIADLSSTNTSLHQCTTKDTFQSAYQECESNISTMAINAATVQTQRDGFQKDFNAAKDNADSIKQLQIPLGIAVLVVGIFFGNLMRKRREQRPTDSQVDKESTYLPSD